jgi:hypothetical protein
VGVPGAFTPSCSSQVPAYIEKYDEFKAKGVNEIFIVSVNDAYVTKCVQNIFVLQSLTCRKIRAWKEKLAPNGTSKRNFFVVVECALKLIDLFLVTEFKLSDSLRTIRRTSPRRSASSLTPRMVSVGPALRYVEKLVHLLVCPSHSNQRYVLITEGETVEKVLVEDHPPDVKVTEASSVLNQL